MDLHEGWAWSMMQPSLYYPKTDKLIRFNWLYAIDAHKRHGCAWALLQPWALSNKLCIRSVVRVGPPIVICEVSFRSPWRAERSKREKPWRLLISSIAKVTYWPRFLSNAYEERQNASYRGTADLRLHSYQDSFEAASHCQREKPKTVHTQQAIKKYSAKSSCRVFHKHFLSTH